MRLLQLESSGEVSLTDDLYENIPPYATLSHTWGPDAQEVTLKDLVDGTGRNKDGYKKIEFCRDRAARDGLHFFWVDTCCIDKANNSELFEAINSMFQWFYRATKCYAFLSDVSIGNWDRNVQLNWERAFLQSRWFTRGWTLQELLAPTSVEFFSAEGKPLGNKKSLEQQIHKRTGIPVQALQGRALSSFSVGDRMSWAENRETRRKEDKAYSLLGIFDIYMPLIYGEGEKNALRRLREEINKLEDHLTLPLNGLHLDNVPRRKVTPFVLHDAQKEGPRHTFADTLDDGLAHIYVQQNRYDEVEPLFKRALTGREGKLGPTHLDTLSAACGLADIYLQQDRYDESERLFKRLLTGREEKLGPTHLDTIRSAGNLADVYAKQGQYDKAKPLFKRLLTGSEKKLGPMHLDTLSAVDGLAGIYQQQGRYDEAERLSTWALSPAGKKSPGRRTPTGCGKPTAQSYRGPRTAQRNISLGPPEIARKDYLGQTRRHV